MLEDAAAMVAAREQPPELEARILRRAEVLGEREGWRDALLRWLGRAWLGLALLAVVAAMLGFGAAAGVLGDGSRPVNVVWALAGLLGVHLLSLGLWLGAMLLSGALAAGAGLHAGGVPARAWLRLVSALDRSPRAADLPLALGGLLGRGRAASSCLGAVSHGLWALALAGATLGVLVMFATRRYGFVWETTILPDQVFTSLAAGLGALPARLGFPIPDAATVAASGNTAMLGEAGRHQWAGWLLGCLLVYGVLPRVALTLACALAGRSALRRVALDLSRPGYARLRARLLPDSERIGVNDPAPASMPRPGRRGVHPDAGETPALVALELGDDLTWPPAFARQASALPGLEQLAPGGEATSLAQPQAPFNVGRLDSREQRRAVLARFDSHPPRRLLIAVDARQTPDRGSLGLIAELADRAVVTRVWAVASPGAVQATALATESDAAGERLRLWREGLASLGFADDAVLTRADEGRAWLEESR